MRLGFSPETVRDRVRKGHLPASRTPTGQLAFDEEDVEALRRGEPEPVEILSPPPPPAVSRAEQRSRDPSWKEMAPWQAEVEEAQASLTLDDVETERERRLETRERERQTREHAENQSARMETQRQRIECQKKRVFQLVWIEEEYRAQLAAAIESFATPERVPGWLSDSEQYDLLAVHARGVLQKLRAEAAQLGAEARRLAQERQREKDEKFAEQMRALFQPPKAVPPQQMLPPGSVAEALRRRRE